MKAVHFSVAAVLATCVGQAVAQPNVTLYGSLDVGIEYQKVSAGSTGGARNDWAFANGSSKANRLGLRGAEDLGGGSSIFFVLEGGLDLATGNSVPNGVLFNRRSIVGAKGPWGELSLGRDYTPAFWAMAYTDYTKSGMYGGAGPTSQIVELGLIRQSDGVFYTSPTVNGFSARVFWSNGTPGSTPTTNTGQMVGLSGHYVSGPAAAGIFYEQKRVEGVGAKPSGTNRYQGVTGQYDFGQFTINGGYSRYDPAGPNTATSGTMNSVWLGLMVPVGAAQVSLTLGHIRTSLAAPEDGKTWLYGLNYLRPLSKRTSLYAGIGKASNNNHAAISLDTGQRAIFGNGLGSDVTAVMVGMRHTF
ncbi:porin [Paralcaligenes sp. KSB-10]|uniref:porin n=1 Tax=Paralcaligenes sp. KSB-10 TaxID=2901142 RepID=UPI001E4206FC|nr:porin [Paralcaligenes sp. KSB-10]UHL63136.1 porin [Paralcaligenes sp. KSB-10]